MKAIINYNNLYRRLKGQISSKFRYFLEESNGKIFTPKLIVDNASTKAYTLNEDTTEPQWVFFENEIIFIDDCDIDKYVWYASYGSNMLEERFLKYITGGSYEGRDYYGCRNKSLPLASRPVFIPHPVYFANKSGTWGGCGAAFLDTSKKGGSYGRMYLITSEQYEDLRDQEGRSPNWYNKEIILGQYGGINIKTFTNSRRLEDNEPSEKYLDTIKKGIQQMYRGICIIN